MSVQIIDVVTTQDNALMEHLHSWRTFLCDWATSWRILPRNPPGKEPFGNVCSSGRGADESPSAIPGAGACAAVRLQNA